MSFPCPAARVTATVDTHALTRNFGLLRALAHQNNPSARVIAVVKANAYGHGLSLSVPAFARAGCRHFAVATLQEALAVRALSPRADILILGYAPPESAGVLAEKRLTQTVFSTGYARLLSRAAAKAGKTVRIHLKWDGGMVRLGFRDRDALLRAAELPFLSPAGLFTHFPRGEDPALCRPALRELCAVGKALSERGHRPLLHAAASAALLSFPESTLAAVRPGLALYGLSPVRTELPLSPALSLSTFLSDLHRVPAGTPIGYGGDFVTERPSFIGTCPVGYADGFPRALSGFSVTVCSGGKTFRAPVVGRVCMDQLMLDLTGIPAAPYDRVVLWDNAQAPADFAGTIPYEILTALSDRVVRERKKDDPLL